MSVDYWSPRASTIAVVRVETSAYFSTAEPPFISTMHSLTVLQTLKGVGPTSISVRGGRLNDIVAIDAEGPTLDVGRSYLVFVWPGPHVVFAPPMKDSTTALIFGEEYSITSVANDLANTQEAQ